MMIPSKAAFHVGSIMLMTVVIGAACHLVIWSVFIERKEYQLSFIMSLPIDALDYALSKLAGGIIMYLVPWSVLLAITLAVVHFSHVPDGLLPFTLIMFIEVLAAYIALISVAITTQSDAWTIITMVVLNMMFSVFMVLLGGNPEIGSYLQEPVSHWNAAAVSVLTGEAFFIAAVLALTLLVLSRRRCFL
jgi:ABC-type Na+ efflux pump permease subunit